MRASVGLAVILSSTCVSAAAVTDSATARDGAADAAGDGSGRITSHRPAASAAPATTTATVTSVRRGDAGSAVPAVAAKSDEGVDGCAGPLLPSVLSRSLLVLMLLLSLSGDDPDLVAAASSITGRLIA